MARSLKKGPHVDERLMEKMKKSKPGEVIKTWSRACTIIPEMVGFAFGVHNGRQFIEVRVTEDMVGHKLGEFSSTTKFSRHGGRMQRDLETQVAEKEAAKVEAVKKEFGKDFIVVVPGIRPAWGDVPNDDQKRISTPYAAIKNGADYIVVGRPIKFAKSPLDETKRISEEIEKALKELK